jgi:predicted RNase H-like nuclease (RuvC/YqgF family)
MSEHLKDEAASLIYSIERMDFTVIQDLIDEIEDLEEEVATLNEEHSEIIAELGHTIDDLEEKLRQSELERVQLLNIISQLKDGVVV